MWHDSSISSQNADSIFTDLTVPVQPRYERDYDYDSDDEFYLNTLKLVQDHQKSKSLLRGFPEAAPPLRDAGPNFHVLPSEGYLTANSEFMAKQIAFENNLPKYFVVSNSALSVPLEDYDPVTKYGATVARPSGEAVVVYQVPKIVDHAESSGFADYDTDASAHELTLYQVKVMKQGLVASGKRGKNKGKKRKGGRMPNVASTSRSNVTVINKLICNAETHVPIQYLDPTALRNNVGVSSCSWRYAVNNPFQVDPSVAATVPGRSYLAGLYNYCRVTHAKVRIVFTNNEAFNVQCGFFPLGGGAADPGLNNAGVSASGAQQPLARSFELGAIGGQNRKALTMKMSIPNWTGLPASATDDNYLSFGGVAPANLVYCPVYVRTGAAGVVLVAGVTIEATVKMWCEWSGRALVTT